MQAAKNGDVVSVHYTGTFDDKNEFDSSQGRDPLIFVLGQGEVIDGFEQAIVGMIPGQTKSVHIPCEQAYGEHDEERVMLVPRNEIPAQIPLEVGIQLQVNAEDGAYPVTVTAITGDQVVLDGNHPLAGHNLNFELTLVEIMKEMPAHLLHGDDCGCGG
ncbi:MAG: peptidylprolyl isomerase [Nitrospirota bacterium]|nr:peptidylprolyl isomerase [Nitrospirota bacterium]